MDTGIFHTFTGSQSGQTCESNALRILWSIFASVITERREMALLYARQLKCNGPICNPSLQLVFITEFSYDSHPI